MNKLFTIFFLIFATQSFSLEVSILKNLEWKQTFRRNDAGQIMNKEDGAHVKIQGQPFDQVRISQLEGNNTLIYKRKESQDEEISVNDIKLSSRVVSLNEKGVGEFFVYGERSRVNSLQKVGIYKGEVKLELKADQSLSNNKLSIPQRLVIDQKVNVIGKRVLNLGTHCSHELVGKSAMGILTLRGISHERGYAQFDSYAELIKNNTKIKVSLTPYGKRKFLFSKRGIFKANMGARILSISRGEKVETGEYLGEFKIRPFMVLPNDYSVFKLRLNVKHCQ